MLISPLHERLASTAATACRGPLGAPFRSSPDSTRFPAAIPGQRAISASKYPFFLDPDQSPGTLFVSYLRLLTSINFVRRRAH
ncbi:hypothetical protein [Stutzerimonas degradans]